MVRFLERQEAPQRLPRVAQERPRSAQESPRRVKMSPRRPKMTLRRPNMTPRRAKRSPRRAKVSSGRLPGAFWEGFPTHFQATRGDRDAPYSNRRRGRVAPEQGYRLALRLACFRSLPRDRAREFRKRRTRNSRLCTVVLCLLLLAVVCARLLVFSVACDACGSRFSRASRSSIARFRFLGVFVRTC